MQTVVILHGWGQSSQAWQNAFGGYPDIEVIAFDLPGFGQEPLPPGVESESWGVPDYAQWVRQKIKKEQLQSVALLGHSFGGRIAARIASERPAWLSALILYGAPCLYRPSASVQFKKRIVKMAKAIGARGRYRGNPELLAAERRGLGAIYRRVVSYDQIDELKNIAVPTLLVWGENDKEVPIAIAREMQQLIPHSRFSLLPKLGHHAHIENPILFYGTAKKFLDHH